MKDKDAKEAYTIKFYMKQLMHKFNKSEYWDHYNKLHLAFTENNEISEKDIKCCMSFLEIKIDFIQLYK